MQLLKFASNAVNRMPLPETHLCVQNDDDLCHGGNGGRKKWWRGCECTERRHAAGPLVVVACINHPSARHSHSQAPKPRVWFGRQWCSIIRFACRVLTYTCVYIYVRTHVHIPAPCSKPRYIYLKRTSFDQSKSWYVADIQGVPF